MDPEISGWLARGSELLLTEAEALGHPAIVTTAQGRHIAASAVPWLRVREVWVHAIDLGAGIGFEDLPHALALRLLSEVTGSFKNRPCPAVTVCPTDAETRFTTRLDESDPGPTVTGTTAELLQWATGRGGPDRPTLPVWL